MNYPSWSRSVVWMAALVLVGGPVSVAEARDADPELTVDMPEYVVEDTRVLPKAESWRYVKVPALVMERGTQITIAPGYEVLSNESEKNTRLFVSELQLRQFAGAYLWPMLVKGQPKQPMVVILDRSKQAWLSRDAQDAVRWTGDPIAEAVPRSVEFVSDAFDSGAWLVELERTAVPAPISDFVLPEAEPVVSRFNQQPVDPGAFDGQGRKPLPPGFVVVTAREGLIAAQVNADEPMAGAVKPTEEQLAANLSAWMGVAGLEGLSTGAPRWFQAGLHRLIELTEATPTRITFARGVIDGSINRFSLLRDVLTKETAFTEEDKVMATTFTHFCLYGRDGERAQQFMTFLTRVVEQGYSDELFEECFGKSVKTIDQHLESYGRSFAAYRTVETRGKMPAMPEFTVVEATQAEVARLQASALITQGKADQALDRLRIAYWRGEREPEMLALLAALEERLGSEDRARKISKALMELPAPPTRAVLVAAKLRFRDAIAGKPEGEKLKMTETRAILGMLARPVNAGEKSEELWVFFSEVVLRSAGRPHESIGALLTQAAARYPKNATIREAAEMTLPPASSHKESKSVDADAKG